MYIMVHKKCSTGGSLNSASRERKMNVNERERGQIMSHVHSRSWTENFQKYEPDSLTELNVNERRSRSFFSISASRR